MLKHIQTILLQKLTNCLSVFDHFVGWTLKWLSHSDFWEIKKINEMQETNFSHILKTNFSQKFPWYSFMMTMFRSHHYFLTFQNLDFAFCSDQSYATTGEMREIGEIFQGEIWKISWGKCFLHGKVFVEKKIVTL